MADTFANTVLLEARLWQQDNMREKFDQRKALTQIYKVFLDGQNYIPDLAAIKKALKKGESVTLVGFGTFSVSKRKARKGRNPQTGEAIKIAAKKVPVFKAGKGLKDAVK